MLARGGGWLAELAGRLKPNGGVGKAAHREGRGEPGQLKKKNPFQISFKFWIWQNFRKLYREILMEFAHGDFS
jgi:hypothetical protein